MQSCSRPGLSNRGEEMQGAGVSARTDFTLTCRDELCPCALPRLACHPADPCHCHDGVDAAGFSLFGGGGAFVVSVFPCLERISGFEFSGFLQQFPSVMVVCLRFFHGARQGDACMAHGDPGLPCDFTAVVCRSGGRRRMTNLVVFSRLSGGNPAETSAVVSNCRLFSGNRTPLSLQNGPVLVSL